jgi:hypothetical protein
MTIEETAAGGEREREEERERGERERGEREGGESQGGERKREGEGEGEGNPAVEVASGEAIVGCADDDGSGNGETANAEWAREWKSGYFGMDREVRERRGEKFLSESKEKEVREFLEGVLGVESVRGRIGSGEDVKGLMAGLKDGVLLCQLSNALAPGITETTHTHILSLSSLPVVLSSPMARSPFNLS